MGNLGFHFLCPLDGEGHLNPWCPRHIVTTVCIDMDFIYRHSSESLGCACHHYPYCVAIRLISFMTVVLVEWMSSLERWQGSPSFYLSYHSITLWQWFFQWVMGALVRKYSFLTLLTVCELVLEEDDTMYLALAWGILWISMGQQPNLFGCCHPAGTKLALPAKRALCILSLQ